MPDRPACITPHDPRLHDLAALLRQGGVAVTLGRACLADGTCHTWLEYSTPHPDTWRTPEWLRH